MRILLMLLFIGSLALAMEQQHFVKVPASYIKKQSKAKNVLAHAGYSENNIKIDALVKALTCMEQSPEFIDVQAVQLQDPLNEAGKSPKELLSQFDYIKYTWQTYRNLAKEAKIKAEDSQSDGSCVHIQELAQELVDNSLDLLVSSQQSVIKDQKRKTRIAVATGIIATGTAAALSAYLGYHQAKC